jgi:hypothetical protein
MTLSAITGTQQMQPAASGTPTSKQPAASTRQSAAETQDTVQLSGTAQAQLSAIQAAAQEAAETPFQTAKEAQSGDPQAQRLLAKEAAAAKAATGA